MADSRCEEQNTKFFSALGDPGKASITAKRNPKQIQETIIGTNETDQFFGVSGEMIPPAPKPKVAAREASKSFGFTSDFQSIDQEVMLRQEDDLLNPFLFRCNQCPLRFNTAQFLRKHKAKVHGEPLPYKCHRCNFSSADYAYYRRHLMMHSEVKPFGCTFCSYASAYKHNLKSHIKNMHGEYLIKCPQCFEKFITTEELDRHIRYQHFMTK
ncbi:protein krueppel-like [Galendromus occidentalis]|uniref:Protein krueppel-like n=1 Tax=Galendromus occidentalis TaxID=34638 RepID=A0AAJ7SH47_9ACAR|nr:protein krueppel-like [Galendromus occidentalis]